MDSGFQQLFMIMFPVMWWHTIVSRHLAGTIEQSRGIKHMYQEVSKFCVAIFLYFHILFHLFVKLYTNFKKTLGPFHTK